MGAAVILCLDSTGVFMRRFRATIGLYVALLVLVGILLVVGESHFLSDVIAGAFVGVSIGIVAGDAWVELIRGPPL